MNWPTASRAHVNVPLAALARDFTRYGTMKAPGERADYLLSPRFDNASPLEIRVAIIKEIEEAVAEATKEVLESDKRQVLAKLRNAVADLSAKGLANGARAAAEQLKEMEKE